MKTILPCKVSVRLDIAIPASAIDRTEEASKDGVAMPLVSTRTHTVMELFLILYLLIH